MMAMTPEERANWQDPMTLGLGGLKNQMIKTPGMPSDNTSPSQSLPSQTRRIPFNFLQQLGTGGPKQNPFLDQFSQLQEQMGGFGEQFTGLETSLGGLGESITAITDRLDSIEQGIQGLRTNNTNQAYNKMYWHPFSMWGRRY